VHDRTDRVEHVLADRLAAMFIRREPGYLVPRRTALARRFEVTSAEVDAAIEELVRRQLLRRLPTGEVHRAGPAEYVIRLDGLPGLSSFVDPMDHQVSCAAVRTSRLRAPTDVAEALGIKPGMQVHTRRCLWIADGEPAAASVTYVPDDYAYLIAARGQGGQSPGVDMRPSLAVGLAGLAELDRPGVAIRPGAVRIEVQPPPRSVARRLRLANGAPAVTVTARLDAVGPDASTAASGPSARSHSAGPNAVALTVLALRPDLFRVVLDTCDAGDVARSEPVQPSAES